MHREDLQGSHYKHCTPLLVWFSFGVMVIGNRKIIEEHNKSENERSCKCFRWKICSASVIFFYHHFYFHENELSFDLLKLGKSIRWRTLITFQMNGKAFLKRMLKNRMNIRWCFINVYARTRYPKILKLPNNKICVKLTPWALKLSRPTKKWSARS